MTEYVILTGLIAILLVTAVERFKTQIEVTIVGTTDAFGNHNVGDPSGANGPKKPQASTRTLPDGTKQHFDTATQSWVND